MIENFDAGTTKTGLNIKQSTADPVAIDMGNISTQGRVVSKTAQFALFTNNRNAIWAGANMLRRISYPFATIEAPVNRNLFRHEVGDCIKFTFARYGIFEKIYRIVQKQEEGPESEKIIVTLMEELYGIVNIDDGSLAQLMISIGPTDFTTETLTHVKIIEMPYVFGSSISLLAMAGKENGIEIGFQIYRSLDGGVSYSLLETTDKNYGVYGTLLGEYNIDAPDIDATGFVVTINDDSDLIITATMNEVLAGTVNLAIINNEIISFQTITPITATTFLLTNVVRERYGTRKATHATTTPIWILPDADVDLTTSPNFVHDASFYFKLVPYNIKQSGVIADATALPLTITDKINTPYCPVNFDANGRSYASRYSTDIVLTWSARKRGEGSGLGVPGTVLPTTGHEGLFEIKTYVGGALVRTTTTINAVTFTYTEAMNLSDNGALADRVVFTITNYLTTDGIRYDSSLETVTCIKN